MKVRNFGELFARVTGGPDREGGGDGPVVVLLHGFGAPGNDLVSLWRVLTAPPGTRFVFPEAPLDLGTGGRAWWWIDLERRLRRQALGEALDVSEVPEGLAAARAKLESLLDAIASELRPPPGKLVVGGFSQGAMLAFDVALHSSRALAGVAFLSGTHITAQEWASRLEEHRGFPVFMSHGQDDPLLPFSVATDLRDLLIARGLAVEWVPFRGGHGIPPNVVDALGGFLRRVLG